MQPLPLGDPVQLKPEKTPRQIHYKGEYITLSPLSPKQDVSELFACSRGTEIREQLWTYMAYGPFPNAPAMQSWLEQIQQSPDPLFFTVRDKQSGQCIGMVSFLNIVPDARRLELGNMAVSQSGVLFSFSDFGA